MIKEGNAFGIGCSKFVLKETESCNVNICPGNFN